MNGNDVGAIRQDATWHTGSDKRQGFAAIVASAIKGNEGRSSSQRRGAKHFEAVDPADKTVIALGNERQVGDAIGGSQIEKAPQIDALIRVLHVGKLCIA